MVFVVRCLQFVAFGVFLAISAGGAAQANSKYAAFVVHADSGDVLFDRYSTSRRYPASLTKMMTLYILFEEVEAGRLSLTSDLKASARAAGQPPSKLGIGSGKTIKVETAIKVLVVKSANDVAVVVAESISGTEWQFAKKMTAKARELGMRRTTFKNASGLPNRKQVTTARDMATLSRRLIQDFPQYFDYFSTKSVTWNGRTYRTHNSLVKSFDGVDGLKTGYTRRSGFNLATSIDRNGNRLIGVVLGGRSVRTRDAHMRTILTGAYAKIKKKPALIAALHRNKPEPRLKPNLLAQIERENAVPTIAANSALQEEIQIAAAAFGPVSTPSTTDQIGALIAAASPADLNEYESAKLYAMTAPDSFLGEGDVEDISNSLNGWGVQIGAYSTKMMAQSELEAAAFKSGLTDWPRSVAPMIKGDGSTLYRARFVRLTEDEAGQLCDTLRAYELTCFSLLETIAR